MQDRGAYEIYDAKAIFKNASKEAVSEFNRNIDSCKSKKNPPDRCKGCWIFKESRFYEKPPVQVSEGVLKLMRETGE